MSDFSSLFDAHENAYALACYWLGSEFNVVLDVTCHAFPLQIEGVLANGNYLYFRARHNEWEVRIVHNKADLWDDTHLAFFRNGDYQDRLMPASETANILAVVLRQYGTSNQ